MIAFNLLSFYFVLSGINPKLLGKTGGLCMFNMFFLFFQRTCRGPNKSDLSTFALLSFYWFKQELTSCHIITLAILIPLVMIIEISSRCELRPFFCVARTHLTRPDLGLHAHMHARQFFDGRTLHLHLYNKRVILKQIFHFLYAPFDAYQVSK